MTDPLGASPGNMQLTCCRDFWVAHSRRFGSEEIFVGWFLRYCRISLAWKPIGVATTYGGGVLLAAIRGIQV